MQENGTITEGKKRRLKKDPSREEKGDQVEPTGASGEKVQLLMRTALGLEGRKGAKKLSLTCLNPCSLCDRGQITYRSGIQVSICKKRGTKKTTLSLWLGEEGKGSKTKAVKMWRREKQQKDVIEFLNRCGGGGEREKKINRKSDRSCIPKLERRGKLGRRGLGSPVQGVPGAPFRGDEWV